MTFGAAIQSCLSKYAVFQGRAPRSEFWWFYLFTVLVEFAAMFFGGRMLVETVTTQGMPPISPMMGWMMVGSQSWVAVVVHLALFLPTLAVAVRRLHDVGRSGWWLLIAFVPLGIFVLLYWWVQPSEPRGNAHGPAPQGLLPPA